METYNGRDLKYWWVGDLVRKAGRKVSHTSGCLVKVQRAFEVRCTFS